MRWFWAAGAACVAGAALWGCAGVLLPSVPAAAAHGTAPPPLLGQFESDPPVADADQWRQRRAPLLRAALHEAVYGPAPPTTPVRVLKREPIAYAPLDDIARVEQWDIAVTPGDDPAHFHLVLITPLHAETPAPLILMQNFCGNRIAFPERPEAVAEPLTPKFWACDASWADPLVQAVFGRYINGPPFAEVMHRGYALGMFYAGDVVGDEPVSAREGLAKLYGDEADKAGAVAVWAWLYSRALDALADDPRLDPARVVAWGHSRNGKAALLAAADDPRIAAVIAHQSGRGGAALSHGASGESLEAIMKEYGYWFTPAFAHADETDPALDQHQLLALIAPRPVFLGNGRRDAWADPQGAFRAAQSADAAYELLGSNGLEQDRLDDGALSADLAFMLRGGTHGVTSQDWRMFLDFLDAHLRQPQVSPQP